MGNLAYDNALAFGELDLTDTTLVFPTALNLGRRSGSSDHYPGKEYTGAGRMTVDVLCDAPAGGSKMTVTVQGSADGTNFTGNDIGKNIFAIADMKAGPCQVAISPNKYQFLQVTIAKDGTFTAGSVKAFLNTYAGK